MEDMLLIILGFAFSGLIGAAVGRTRDRAGAGFFWGVLLGPLGWLVVWMGPDLRPKCPECHGVIEAGAARCKNCRIELVYGATPAMSGGCRIPRPVARAVRPVPCLHHPMPHLRAALILACLAAAAGAFAQSGGLSVKRLSTMKQTDKNWTTDYGSYDKDQRRACSILIEYRNMTVKKGEFVIEWNFIARKLDDQLFIYDKGSAKASLDVGQSLKTNVQSLVMSFSDLNLAALGERYTDGAKIAGYIVRVFSATNLVASYASAHELDPIASKPDVYKTIPQPTEEEMEYLRQKELDHIRKRLAR